MGARRRVRTGAPWRDLPSRYGPWQTVYGSFRRWQRAGVWARVITALQARADAAGLIDHANPAVLDATPVVDGVRYTPLDCHGAVEYLGRRRYDALILDKVAGHGDDPGRGREPKVRRFFEERAGQEPLRLVRRLAV